jgi:hypothetical protein
MDLAYKVISMRRFEIVNSTLDYWTLSDSWFFPCTRLTAKETLSLPTPFFVYGLPPDNKIGSFTKDLDEFTNKIPLKGSFDELDIDNDLRKDLKRIEKKNLNCRLIFNKKDDLDTASRWFLNLWDDETPEHFARRKELYLKNCNFISLYNGDELIAFHISWDYKDLIFYCGCWWNRAYKNQCPATFLLKKDIERAISLGKRFYDLGLGDEAYKKRWHPISVPTKYYAKMDKETAAVIHVEVFDEVKAPQSLKKK